MIAQQLFRRDNGQLAFCIAVPEYFAKPQRRNLINKINLLK